ncbi:uncharacterized protein CLUP02_12573 [Colletotrichum lupini]|uniref:Uncharacterized protein n=1 Tax=Colletotrichum lupini TaxID=145971 RepID=A0A9Q8T2L5_9PEZI|nr:uncharacterized protein CLUP02_12573 [Colletotrichum lupini]UQC87071.1 hypothetical protein CLUP02_12573 [Colletotrichum lupini]
MEQLVLKKDDLVCAGDNEGNLVALPSESCRCDFGSCQKQTEAITLEAISMRGRRGDRWSSCNAVSTKKACDEEEGTPRNSVKTTCSPSLQLSEPMTGGLSL